MGWSKDEMNMGPLGTYTMFKHGEKAASGMMKSESPGVPTHWLVYVGVDDVDATAKKIAELGGKILVPPTDVPDMLRFSVAMDPQGAAFGVTHAIGPMPEPAPTDESPAAGTFCWNELHTKDTDAASKFYAEVFGWTGKYGEDPMKYWHWQNAGKDIGGMMKLMMPDVPPNWLAYLATDDVDASALRVTQLGGKVMMPALDIPKVGKFSVVADPTGGVFALFKSAPR